VTDYAFPVDPPPQASLAPRSVLRGSARFTGCRTWAGTILALQALRNLEPVETPAQAKRNVRLAVEEVARELGNSRTVCRKCYIHPAVMEAYLEGTLDEGLRRRRSGIGTSGLRSEEAMLLAFLHAMEHPP
jgi:DNA topoisomerase-1